MSLPFLDESDLELLAKLTPDLDFNDSERRAVLLESNSADINATPGSGKTTVLAAKLLLLSRKWKHPNQGICVLSHTNVAREEIQTRLQASAIGANLLGYPHFIGTIHAFINQYLALPALRSFNIPVNIIDNDVFASKALRLAKTDRKLRFWMDKSEAVRPMVEGLVYSGEKLEIRSINGPLPSEKAPTRVSLEGIKAKLSADGIFRHEDMFAFAEHLLSNYPKIRTSISTRFPILFLDESQDTSCEQERLLNLLFDESVVVQRYGDVNQRILGGSGDSSSLTFPKAGCLHIGSSKRFGSVIANAVSKVQLNGKAVTGHGDNSHPLILFTYAACDVEKVIHAFGSTVLERFSDADLSSGKIKALCARKQGDAKTVQAGRTLRDFWPSYVESTTFNSDSFWGLINGCQEFNPSATLKHRAVEIRRAIALILQELNLQSGNQISVLKADTPEINLLVRELVLSEGDVTTEEGRKTVIKTCFRQLSSLLNESMNEKEFSELEVFSTPNIVPDNANESACLVSKDGRTVSVEIGTVASMKGETHLATLVLESYGWPSRKFDIEEALPVIAGISPISPKLKEGQLSQFRNLYVGMSRPRQLLALAVNESRVKPEWLTALSSCGWLIVNV